MSDFIDKNENSVFENYKLKYMHYIQDILKDSSYLNSKDIFNFEYNNNNN